MMAEPPCGPMPEVFTTEWRSQQRRLYGMCVACPMLVACRKHVLTNDVEGYAAAMTPSERRRIRRARAGVAA